MSPFGLRSALLGVDPEPAPSPWPEMVVPPDVYAQMLAELRRQTGFANVPRSLRRQMLQGLEWQRALAPPADRWFFDELLGDMQRTIEPLDRPAVFAP